MAQYPQQAVPVMAQQPVIPGQDTARPGFAHHTQHRLGIVQILCGILLIAVAVAMIFCRSSLFFFGYGIWTGLFFITAGALGVSSAKSKNTCPIVGCLIMCIFSLMAATVVIAFGSIGLAIDARYCSQGTYDSRYNEDCERTQIARYTNIAWQATNLLTGLFEWIVALIQMIICCRALCCAPSRRTGTIYYTAAPQQILVSGQYPQHPQQQQPQQQQPQVYPQYQPQAFGQPYAQGGQYPDPAYGQPAYPGMNPYGGGAAYQSPSQSGVPYQPPVQPGAPPMYPQMQCDDGRPPPYNPGLQGPSAPATNVDDSYPVKQ